MQRACALAYLYDGKTIIKNAGKSNDDLAALQIIEDLGVTVISMGNGVGEIIVNGYPGLKTGANQKTGILQNTEEKIINCGESGLSIRMFTPIVAISESAFIITGEGSLMNRPMDFFGKIFPQLGVTVELNNGKLPLKIKGPLIPKDITVDGSQSSQFLTGMLIAFAKITTKPVTITVTNLISKPYIDLTLQMMKHFGYEIENENYCKFYIKPRTAVISRQAKTYTVENDWSGAAFLLVAGAIAGEITLKGLDVFSAQGDKAILQVLMMTAAFISVNTDEIVVKTNKLKPFHFNATECPDLFPPLVALAACCEGISVIEGTSRLLHKESNRALSLQVEFAKMGVEIKLQGDLMIITGATKINGAILDSHQDHRIAMACAVAALRASGKTIINEAEAVNKSYPGFYEHLKLLGANVSLQINN